jgi:guanine deaminase
MTTFEHVAPNPQGILTDLEWLERAVLLATENVAAGGGPFGALVTMNGKLVSTGVNRVTRDFDPSAHAEVVAIRNACAALSNFSLEGAVLFSSCEPCPMCAATALWARLDRVVFAADRHDAARGGFDDRTFYDLFGQDSALWPTPVLQHPLDNAGEPFDAWLATDDRTSY